MKHLPYTLQTLKDAPPFPATVLMRVDYNVPLEHGQVADDRRLRESLPTIQALLGKGHKVVLLSHLGRPNGPDPQLSLEPIAKHIHKHLGQPIQFVADTIGQTARQAIEELEPGTALLLENVRFFSQEEQNDAHFAQQLCHNATFFVNDAFSAAHRAHASTVGVTKYLPSFAGLSLQQEVETLGSLITDPKRPFVIVLGGAKISDKVDVVRHLAKVADCVLVGGAIANNFLKADGLEIHKSFFEERSADVNKRSIDYIRVARNLLRAHKTERMLLEKHIPLPKIIYPIDVLAAPNPEAQQTEIEHIDLTRNNKDTPDDRNIKYFDIGPNTCKLFKAVLSEAKTIFWNGPMGYWEKPQFSSGTKEIAEFITHSKAHTVLGGGDTNAAVNNFGLEGKYSYSSAAGGAALEFLSGKLLPGIKPLRKR